MAVTSIFQNSRPPAFPFFHKTELYNRVYVYNHQLLGADHMLMDEWVEQVSNNINFFAGELQTEYEGMLLVNVDIDHPAYQLKGFYYVTTQLQLYKISEELYEEG